MPQHGLIDVRVLVNNQSLPEYPDPDEHDIHNAQLVRYILAEAGQTFKIQVRWLPGYPLHWAPYLYARLTVDGHSPSQYIAVESSKLKHKKGRLSADLDELFGSVRAKDMHGKWKIIYRAFGALGLTDLKPKDGTFDTNKLDQLGSIEVSVYRAHQVARATPYIDDGILPQVLDEIPESVMKGKTIKTNTKFQSSEQDATAPEPLLHQYVPISGPAGLVTKFIFKYRNKKILQHLGCIPRSPSPEPDHALIAARTEAMLKSEKEARRRANLEILRLRQELEQQQRGSRESTDTLVDIDDTHDTTDVSVETEERIVTPPPSRGVKRERDETDEDLQELAPLPKKPAVLIDLTDDN